MSFWSFGMLWATVTTGLTLCREALSRLCGSALDMDVLQTLPGQQPEILPRTHLARVRSVWPLRPEASASLEVLEFAGGLRSDRQLAFEAWIDAAGFREGSCAWYGYVSGEVAWYCETPQTAVHGWS